MTPNNFILQTLQSRSTPIKRKDLLRLLLSNGFQITDRAMRKEIYLLRKQGANIGSSNKGYKKVMTIEEREAARLYFKKIAWACWEEAALIYKNFNREFRPDNLKQLTFEDFMK